MDGNRNRYPAGALEMAISLGAILGRTGWLWKLVAETCHWSMIEHSFFCFLFFGLRYVWLG